MKTPKIRNPLFTVALATISAAAFAQTPAMTEPSTERAPTWSESDTSRDGFLSKDELIPFPGVLKQFEIIDTDGDGKISESEYKTWLDARKR
ncbi:hypothetical protein ACQQ2N_12655 [Dokdonella sp. MW10]|uniref:hypothetical protein n=1 Tax=Dokdonella sp. MW10 TaxID=2992926 RepID=UPI003F7FA8A0